MKRSITLVVCALCTWMAMAQDIIVTKDAKRIEAKIQEVSSTEIKYKKFTYQDGPVFVLPIADVNSILFENGDVQVYHQEPVKAQATDTDTNKEVATANQSSQQDNNRIGMIEKRNNYYYLNTDTGTTRMDEQAYLRFIQNNCPEAWQRYLQGNKLWKAGKGLLGAGIGIEFLVGVPLLCAGYANIYKDTYYGYGDDYSNTGYALVASGATFIAIGSLMEAGSIPLLIVGGIRRNNTHEVYNVSCREKTQVSLNVQSGANGIGLALKF